MDQEVVANQVIKNRSEIGCSDTEQFKRNSKEKKKKMDPGSGDEKMWIAEEKEFVDKMEILDQPKNFGVDEFT